MNTMMKIIFSAVMAFTFFTANAQSKKEQIESLTISLDSLNQVLSRNQKYFEVEMEKSSFELDSLNQVLSRNQKYFEVEMEKSSFELDNLNAQQTRLNSKIDSIYRQLKTKDQKIDSLTLNILELSAFIDSLSIPKIDKENNWLLIESNLKLTEKDYSKAVLWFNENVFNGGQNIYTSSCYSYITDATDYYWGYPGSIEEDEFKSNWESKFDLEYSSFGHAFQNGNCGWASFRFSKIEFLGVLNGGDWYKLTIEGGCEENDYSNTIIRVVKLNEENGSFRIENFISIQD